jgi:hypothetical protein
MHLYAVNCKYVSTFYEIKLTERSLTTDSDLYLADFDF